MYEDFSRLTDQFPCVIARVPTERVSVHQRLGCAKGAKETASIMTDQAHIGSTYFWQRGALPLMIDTYCEL